MTTDSSSLAELRLIKPSPHATTAVPAQAADLAAAQATIAAAECDSAITHGAASVTVGLSRAPANGSSSDAAAARTSVTTGHQPPGQQAAANAVPKIGAWAELSDQIARKRAELEGKGGSKSQAMSGIAANGIHGSVTKASTAERKATGIQTPGAARPRGGVRASAMGPMLAYLRSSGGLDSGTL